MPKQVNAAKTLATTDRDRVEDWSTVKIANESNVNGGDNIITISTSSITNECHSSARNEDTLKPPASPKSASDTGDDPATHQHSCSYLKPTATAAANVSTHPANNAEPQKQTRTDEHWCDLTHCISFQENIADVHHRRGRRLHGLQLPLHPLQVFGWLVLILFGIATFCVLIPSFTSEIQGPLYGLVGGLFIAHVVSHLTALLTDPADRELQRVHRNDRIVPEFDRNKHAHVIENGRCHLCNIRTSSQRTKHCSVCNKCVGKFDHHCKWLNHCIGSRNYAAFLMCVVSAVAATIVIVVAVVAQIVLYYVHPEWLSFWQSADGHDANNGLARVATANEAHSEDGSVLFVRNVSGLNDTFGNTTTTTAHIDFATNVTNNITAYLLDSDLLAETNVSLPTLAENVSTLIADTVNDTLLLHLNQTFTAAEVASDDTAGDFTSNNVTAATIVGIGVSDTIFLVLIGVLGVLAAITAGLLMHLCFFHIYISFLGLTTYEYIRNHRQAQELKAKEAISNLPKEDQTHFPLTPSKKTNDCDQMYFCSSTRHPNAINPADLHYFEAGKPPPRKRDSADGRDLRLHCCVNSREYHQSAAKTYYMCSLLEENAVHSPLAISHISGGDSARVGSFYDANDGAERADRGYKTFHCCSTFGALATQRRVSAATSKATLVSDLETISARRSYMQYTEQCTLCTFRVRSPMVSKRVSDVSGVRGAGGRQRHASGHAELSPTPRTVSASSKIVTSEQHQRCCMKSISKHQRWRRKWNCCSNVPDSPDVPNDIIAALAMRHQHSTATSTGGAGKKMNATEIPVHFIKTVNGSGDSTTCSLSSNSRPTSPRSANLKSSSRTRNARTWPLPRLRHMMRMLGRYRRTRCRQAEGNSVLPPCDEHQVKQNQIRPLHLQANSNGAYGRHQLNHHQHQQHCNDSSSPQPPSSTTTASTEERSDQSIYSDSSNLTTPSGQTPNTIETILPTSVIRDDTSMTYTTPMGFTLPPALPPPTRRKIPNPTNLDDLAETLSFVSHSSAGSAGTLSPVQRLPTLSNVYRRQRRKHFLRTRSPTLSPIHETGLSNPTSPQPGRHGANAINLNVAATVAAGDLAELARKSSSNSSLHSVSSNSSST
ncbi:uncharacterized protein LOC101451482 [Ceratitis capitata]|uniref:uncharacterized protein LOC101451482 n=1 Tax=Ceratitis capitata TaxID=7213 RepID=UPI0003299C76|nr:uncharacterized protein LOC101451482 [Ceratitis capitata]